MKRHKHMDHSLWLLWPHPTKEEARAASAERIKPIKEANTTNGKQSRDQGRAPGVVR